MLVTASCVGTRQADPEDDPLTMLAQGMVALFASPVLRVRLTDHLPADENADEICATLVEGIMRRLNEHRHLRRQ